MAAPPNIWRPTQPRTLVLLRDNRRVLPFVGAGLNIPAGMPSGPGLAETLRTRHPLAAGKTFVAPKNLIDVSSTLSAGSNEDRASVVDFILDLLDIDKHGYTTPATVRHLVRAPSKWYVTTTYDLLAERAAEEQGIEYRTFTWRDLPDFDDIDRDVEHSLYIVHLHGCVTDRESLVLDAQSYHDVAQDPGVQDFLHLLFHAYNVCFFGTALDEQYLQGWLLSWRHQRPRHVLIGDQASMDDATQTRGAVSPQMHGVMVEAFPAGDFGVLGEFCEFLVSRPASTNAPITAADPGQQRLPSATSGALQSVPDVRYIRTDWGPDWTRRALADLADHKPEEMLRLQEALGTTDEPSVVEDLIRAPASWMREGSSRLWVAAARFAEQQGDWQLSREAWERAADKDGADRVRCLVSAAASADLAGDPQGYEALMAAARGIDKDHPRVRLQDVSHADDLDAQLGALRDLWDNDGDVGALAHAHAAIAYLMKDDFAEAEHHVEAARRLRPDMFQARIVATNLAIHRNRRALAQGERVDARALAAAKDDALTTRDELVGMSRWVESTRLLMLAVDATTLQGDWEAAGALALSATAEEKDSEDGRVILADAALRAQQADAALELLQGVPETDDVRCMRAQARLTVGDDEVRERAFRDLDALIADRGDQALRAATVRASRAYSNPDAGWSDDAEAVLLDRGESDVALTTKALWLYRAGHLDAAKRLLAPRSNDVRVAEVLLQLAVWERNQAEAARVATSLLALGPDNTTRVRCASALLSVGDVARAQAEATVVVSDPTAATGDKGDGYFLLAAIAADESGDYARALSLFEDWRELDPADERQVWGRALALSRLARHADALNVLDESHAFPRTLHDARLAASVYARMDDPIEALRRITDMLDRLPEPDDEMERQLALLALHRMGGAPLPDDLAERVHLEDTDALKEHLVPLDEVRAQAQQDRQTKESLLRDVMDGDVSTMVLAAAVGKDIGALWMRLSLRPLGFGLRQFDLAEREDAVAALGRGGVLDPTSMLTLHHLGEDVIGPALSSLAGGRAAQASLDDLDDGRTALLPEKATMKRQELTFDSDGEPVVTECARTDIERDHARADGMLTLVERLSVEPDFDAAHPGPADALITDETPTPIRVLAATFAVALRTGLPLYSDDRHVRLLARQAGLPTFGTPALLTALQERGILTPSEVASARRTLRAERFLGVTPTAEELAELLAASNGEPSDDLRAAFRDPAPWKAAYGASLARTLDFLRRVFDEHPDKFDGWVLRLLSTMLNQVQLTRSDAPATRVQRFEALLFHGEWLLAGAWLGAPTTSTAGRPFLCRLRSALDAAMRRLGTASDPLPGAVACFESLVTRATNGQVRGITPMLLVQLPLRDQMQVLGVDPTARPPLRVPALPRSSRLDEALRRAKQRSDSRRR